jgi:Domain of unknown function (DUF6378)
LEHGEILRNSAQMIAKRRETYGQPAECFERAAMIAGAMLDRAVTPFEIATVMHAMKLARVAVSPKNVDHFIDGVSYLAFAAEFADAQPERPNRDTKVIAPAVDGRPVAPIRDGAAEAGGPARPAPP